MSMFQITSLYTGTSHLQFSLERFSKAGAVKHMYSISAVCRRHHVLLLGGGVVVDVPHHGIQYQLYIQLIDNHVDC
jgi:hypothetical protein